MLARPEGRALRPLYGLEHLHQAFQSSPVPKDGRDGSRDLFGKKADRFQSSPVPKDGRYNSPFFSMV